MGYSEGFRSLKVVLYFMNLPIECNQLVCPINASMFSVIDFYTGQYFSVSGMVTTGDSCVPVNFYT